MEQANFESLYPDTTRFLDIQKLEEFIKDGASAQLISFPGVGRATVLGLLANNRKIRIKHFPDSYKSLHFVLVNFSEVRRRPLFDVMKFLFLALSDSLRSRKMSEYKKINDMFRESLKFKDELVLFQALKEAIDFLALDKKLKIVFLFDHFEEYVPTVTSEFFTNLRTLRNRAKYQFSVVFSVNRPLEDLLDPSLLSDYYEFIAGHYAYMNLYDSVTTDFRVAYIKKITGKKLSPEILTKIIKEAGGVGRIIKLSVELLLGSPEMQQSKDLGQKLFNQKTVQGALSEICRSLTPSEQVSLINDKYEDKSIQEYLENVGILREGKIQIPLFEKHIKMHASEPRVNSRKIIYDEFTDSIKIGDVSLSDQLTSSEFKLLSFLLKNPDRITDREAIINVVWSSVKSTAGITDQAVDQLIFRLRKKIEEDHNSPKHLLTVKGRGFRFNP